MITQPARNFYLSHSATSDPGRLSWMLDGLPAEIEKLIDITGGLLLHPHTASDLYGEPEPPDFGAGALTMAEMLQQVRAVDTAALTTSRAPEQRLRVNCGRFAMFFLAALRHLRIPARKRVGFDWDGWIHEIVEYWDDGRGQWILIDPNPATRQPIRDFLAKVGAEGSDSDLEVIRPGEAFTPGALAWRLCRTGQAEASRFKLVGHEGLSGVRVALLQDLDSVNKIELRTFDEWHSLYAAPFDELGDDTLHWFDAAAALVDDHDTGIDDLQAFYATSPHGAAVRTRLHKLVMNGAPS